MPPTHQPVNERFVFAPRRERLLISDDIQRSRVTKGQIALICLTSIISVTLFLLRYLLKINDQLALFAGTLGFDQLINWKLGN